MCSYYQTNGLSDLDDYDTCYEKERYARQYQKPPPQQSPPPPPPQQQREEDACLNGEQSLQPVRIRNQPLPKNIPNDWDEQAPPRPKLQNVQDWPTENPRPAWMPPPAVVANASPVVPVMAPSATGPSPYFVPSATGPPPYFVPSATGPSPYFAPYSPAVTGSATPSLSSSVNSQVTLPVWGIFVLLFFVGLFLGILIMLPVVLVRRPPPRQQTPNEWYNTDHSRFSERPYSSPR